MKMVLYIYLLFLCLFLYLWFQKIKDIKEQMPNKLIKLENNKFKDFACGILG
jgi:hypothetical protein